MSRDTLHRAFEAMARRHPGRIAVSAADATLTYAELDARAERVAEVLRIRGVGPGTLVGLCADRNSALVTGLIGILKAGAAYVPLDPAYPPSRIRLLLADTGATVVVATSETASVVEGPEREVLLVDRIDSLGAGTDIDPERDAAADDVAYVIHTSGSTGTPKGVLVEHRQVLRLFEVCDELFRFGPNDVWTLFHSVSFDFSVWELWGALLHGGRLVVVPLETARSPELLLDLLHRERVTVLNQTPSAFRGLIAADAARPEKLGPVLRTIVFGGERLDSGMLRGWIERYGDAAPELINMYGITETTVHVTHRRIRVADLAAPTVSPIGVPLADLRIRLLNEDGRPVPDGVPGEIHVGGAGLARGYLNRPELTAERFLVVGGERWYRSGDRAVRGPDGELHHVGRSDDQVKVRGYRIEPGEVEACLAAASGIASVVVVPRDHGEGDVRLTAYVLPTLARSDPGLAGRLDRLARAALPAHMRPSAYRTVSELPLTPQGKTDRGRLEEFVVEDPAADSEPDASEKSGELETAVDRIVREVLECPAVGVDADLTGFGATSLSLVRVVMRMRLELGVEVTLTELGERVSVRRLAECAGDVVRG
ncbi:amino acid adenylation domain-containing protein [Streptomyces sp. NPDC091212]|uniref:amino acid adenylation domain-containing protein n=1 Tax=Streptomyces sp. NPDC091212 TaxID=3155191 RepID=UPI003420B3A3